MGRRKHPELYRAQFPLYTIKISPESGLVITAGGGGAAKTGIKNGMHFLRLEQIGGQLSASQIHYHDTETRATMTMALADNFIAAGQDASCHILRYSEAVRKEEKRAGKKEKEGNSVNSKAPRKRKPGVNVPESGGGNVRNESQEIVVENLKVVQSDFSSDELQKCVRFNQDRSLLVTGGADGFIKVWEFPGMKKTLDFKAHDLEIEDLDISPDNKIITVGRDFKCCVWKKDQLVTGLRWNENMDYIPDKMYRYQSCRFGKVEDNKETLRLYTVQIPYKRERKPLPCYISKWDGKNFLPLLTQQCGKEVISCLAVSDSGTFLGLGTVTGSVAIYISFSLQRLYYVKEAHGIVITDLAFLPETPRGKQLMGNNEAALISVAVDSCCKLHLIPIRSSFPVWLVLLLCALMIIVVIILLQHAFPEFL
ncbi:prolactin regulatory element-binding protein [Protopterus annectens]|uniref:prolactin regulatory element-binding protein n=1 Tax=Protopterus annectens TaxID=7888 RepID=UPI001CF984A9|nr:prolactin regulatory element-binding protein [Protopterus annectens]